MNPPSLQPLSSETSSPAGGISPSAIKRTSKGGYALTNVAIVDVEKAIIVPGQAVIITGDRIGTIGRMGEVKIPQDAQVVDGNGLYLMPGLVDAHVHYYDAPVFGRLMVANGVLLVRDTGMPNEFILKLRDELNLGLTLGPEMVATGFILDGTPPIIPLISLAVETPEMGREMVCRQAEAGVNMIKVYSRLSRDAFMAVVDEAHKCGLKVVAHMPESIYLEDAAAAGLDSSEHFNGFEKVIANLLGEPVNLTFRGQATEAGYFLRLNEVDPQKLQAVYERLHATGLTICPTVITFKTLTAIRRILLGDFSHSEYISPALMDMWKSLWSQQGDVPDFIWKNWSQMLPDLYGTGIPLMTGTDLMLPGIIPGFSLHEEMVTWQEAGIPPAAVLRSATVVPARFLGLGERLGSLESGKTASMVLVRGNPLEDIRNAQQVEGVFLRGRYFNRHDLDRLLSEAKDLAQVPAP